MLAGAVLPLMCAGCFRSEMTLEDLGQTLTLAVGPALNHSGSRDFDPIRVADIMASELTFMPGVRVVPLNRTLAQLESDGHTRIESPGQALALVDRLGADGIIVFAITEYEPYNPPVIGMSAQLFGHGPGAAAGLDPVALSRQSAPFEGDAAPTSLRAEHQRVFHGAERRTVTEIKRFARRRTAADGAFGWRKYLASQDEFWRFCCHSTARELIRQEVVHVRSQLDRRQQDADK